MRKLALLVLPALLGASACTVDPTNPFDPDTPPEFQQRGVVEGKIQAVRSPVDGVTAAGLCDVDIDGDHSGFSLALRPLVDDPTLGLGVQTAKTNANGLFQFNNVPPGRYSLEVSGDGFDLPPPRELTVDVGEILDVTLCAINRTGPPLPSLAPLPSLLAGTDPVVVSVLAPVDGATYEAVQIPDGADPLPPVALETGVEGTAPGSVSAALPLLVGDATPARRHWRIEVTGVDALGNRSDAAVADIVRDEIAPAPPEGIGATAGRDRVTVTWQPAAPTAGDDGAAAFLVSYGVVARGPSGGCPFGAPGDGSFDGAAFAVEGPSPVFAPGDDLTLSGLLPGTDLFLYVAGVDAAGNAGCFSPPVRARPDQITFVAEGRTPVDNAAGSIVASARVDGALALARGDGGLTVIDRLGASHDLGGVAFDVAPFGRGFVAARGAAGVRRVPLDADGVPGTPVDVTTGDDVRSLAVRPGRVILGTAVGLRVVDLDDAASAAAADVADGDGAVVRILSRGDLLVLVRAGNVPSVEVVHRAQPFTAVATRDDLPSAPSAAAVLDDQLWLGFGALGVRAFDLDACIAGPGCLRSLAQRALPGSADVVDLVPFDDVMLAAAHGLDGDSIFAVQKSAALTAVGRASLDVGDDVQRIVASSAGDVCAVVDGATDAAVSCFTSASLPQPDGEVRLAGGRRVITVRPEGARGHLLESDDTGQALLAEVRLADGAVLRESPIAAGRALEAAAVVDGLGLFALDDQGGLWHAKDGEDAAAGAHLVAELGAGFAGAVTDFPASGYTGFLETDGQDLWAALVGEGSGDAHPTALFRIALREDDDGALSAAVAAGVAGLDVKSLTQLRLHRGRGYVPTQPFGVLVYDLGDGSSAPALLSAETLAPSGDAVATFAADLSFLPVVGGAAGDENALIPGVDATGVEGFFVLDDAGEVTQVSAAGPSGIRSMDSFGRFVVVGTQTDGAFVIDGATLAAPALQPVLQLPDVASVEEPRATARGVLFADGDGGAAWIVLR